MPEDRETQAEIEETKAILNVPALVHLPTCGETLTMRRLSVREVMINIDVLGQTMSVVFEKKSGGGKVNWTAMAPAMIAACGEPAFAILGSVTEKSPDYIGALDVLDFSEVVLVFVRLHLQVIRNFETLSGLVAKEPRSRDLESQSTRSLGGDITSGKSESSATMPFLPSRKLQKPEGTENCSSCCTSPTPTNQSKKPENSKQGPESGEQTEQQGPQLQKAESH